ncbi:universal stress protein [Lacisediminimonas sp.]|uniref:universal stress protein n=1 Tax=Lacisediminimonas sp. TaxID=3060582 RepID=UPI002719AA0B|nr:universal stress protein [Lacisediminimonas sp.]MDO8298822.1 universal stress protein [Lacisediminimonas sp.]
MTLRQVLIPVSIHSNRTHLQGALAEAIVISRTEPHTRIHLLSIQPPVSLHVADYFKPGELWQVQLEGSRQDLAAPRELLDAAAVSYKTHTLVGRSADVIVQFAQEYRCDRILMGQAGRSGVQEKLFGTLASQVRQMLGVAGNCQVIGT